MKTDKTEWLKFYHRDFFGDENVLCMNNQEVGIYMRFLAFQWDNRTLPIDIESLAGIAREPVVVMKEIWEKSRIKNCYIVTDEGRMYNPRLQLEWEDMVEKYEKRAKSGSKGGKAKALNSIALAML